MNKKNKQFVFEDNSENANKRNGIKQQVVYIRHYIVTGSKKIPKESTFCFFIHSGIDTKVNAFCEESRFANVTRSYASYDERIRRSKVVARAPQGE